MNEILSGIRVIKFYAWESHFTDRIEELRQKELGGMSRRRRVHTVDDFCSALVPVLVSIVLFTSYTMLGHQLSAAKVSQCPRLQEACLLGGVHCGLDQLMCCFISLDFLMML